LSLGGNSPNNGLIRLLVPMNLYSRLSSENSILYLSWLSLLNKLV